MKVLDSMVRPLVALALLAGAGNALASISVTLASPANGTTSPAYVSLNVAASVTSSSNVQRVYFYANGQLIGSDSIAPFEKVWTPATPGTYAIYASATNVLDESDDSATATVTITANNAPTISLTSPTAGASGTAPATFAMAATAADSGGSVANVKFYANGVLVATDSVAPYSASYVTSTPGTHQLMATVTDNVGAVNGTPNVAVTVVAANVAPTVSLTSPVSWETTGVAPASFSVAANAADSDGTVASVKFYAGALLLATDTAAPYATTFSTGTPGSYVLKAVATDDDGTATNSSTITVTVAAADPVSATRKYVYDANQRLCKRIEPESGATIIEYDGAGNVAWTASGQTTLTDLAQCQRELVPVAQRVVNTYDVRNRLKLVDVPNTTNDPTFDYFADGALKSAVNGVVRWDYTYNLRRLPVEEKMTFNTLIRAFTHAYDANGFESSLTYPSGNVVAFAPDALGRPKQAGTYATAVQYHPNGGMRCFNYGNKVVHRMEPNDRRFPERSQDLLVSTQDPLDCNNPATGTAVVDDSYDYDFNGNVAAITDAVVGGGGSREMTYDALDRLTNTNAPSLWWINAATTYDGLDNIRSNKVGTRVWNYVYDVSNRLDQLKTPAGALVRDIATDVRGNITTNGASTYQFDYANRMIQAIGQESYMYDAHGRRARQLRQSDNVAIYPMYSQAGQLLAERNLRDGKLIEYVYLNGSLVAKRAQPTTGGTWVTTYVHTDSLGSPVAETDASGAVSALQKYSPYGEPSSGYKAGPGFTGHVTDAMTGLSYMQQRYYDPMLGRFLSVDPVAVNSADGLNFNRFSYARNNPYRFVDPDGREEVETNSDGDSQQGEREQGPISRLFNFWDGDSTGHGRIVTDEKGNDVYQDDRDIGSAEGDAREGDQIGDEENRIGQDQKDAFFEKVKEWFSDAIEEATEQGAKDAATEGAGRVVEGADHVIDAVDNVDKLQDASPGNP